MPKIAKSMKGSGTKRQEEENLSCFLCNLAMLLDFRMILINLERWSLYLSLFSALQLIKGEQKLGVYFEVKEALKVLYKSDQEL